MRGTSLIYEQLRLYRLTRDVRVCIIPSHLKTCQRYVFSRNVLLIRYHSVREYKNRLCINIHNSMVLTFPGQRGYSFSSSTSFLVMAPIAPHQIIHDRVHWSGTGLVLDRYCKQPTVYCIYCDSVTSLCQKAMIEASIFYSSHRTFTSDQHHTLCAV